MCKAIDDIRLEGYEEGIGIGVERGIDIGIERGVKLGVTKGEVTNTISIVIKKVNKKKTLNIIADEIEEEIEYIRPMYNAVIANPDKDADEIYRILYEDDNSSMS